MRNRRLLVCSDQGFGDAIQFIRYLPRLRERTQTEITFLTPPPLARLFDGLPGIDHLTIEGESDPEFDCWVPLLSIPGLIGLDFSNLQTGHAPYLGPDPELIDFWESMLPDWSKSLFKVGVVWQGNPRQSRDRLRSCPLATFSRFFDREGIAIVSLQQDPAGLSQLKTADLPGPVIEWGSRFSDFADAAAALQVVDLVVTVDTAMCHLAGALGRPTWTLLAASADWRWFKDRDDSPWYPTMRLFRQPEWGEWNAPLDQVALELERMRDVGG